VEDLAEYLDRDSVKTSLSMAISQLVRIINDRHGRLPTLTRNDTFINVAKGLLKIACRPTSSLVTYVYATLYVRARDFWRAVFAVGTIFTLGRATSWDDILPGFTYDCLTSLEQCVLLLSTYEIERTRYSRLLTGSTAGPFLESIASEFRSLGVDCDDNNIGRTLDSLPEQRRRTAFPALVRNVRARVVGIYNQANENLGDEGLQIASRNQIASLCGFLLRLDDVEFTRSNVERMLNDVLGEAGIM